MKKWLAPFLFVLFLFAACSNTESAEEPAQPLELDYDALYLSEAVILGANTPWAVEGYLTLPRKASPDAPVPAVVLVHGSGALDRDMPEISGFFP